MAGASDTRSKVTLVFRGPTLAYDWLKLLDEELIMCYSCRSGYWHLLQVTLL